MLAFNPLLLAAVVECALSGAFPPLDQSPPVNPAWTAKFLLGNTHPYDSSRDIVNCHSKNDWSLSYDDGPGPDTPSLLAELKSAQVKATFFVIGSRVFEYPEILRQAYSDGHQIGIHTWSHPYLTRLTNDQIIAEIIWTCDAIKQVIGVVPRYVRAPYGNVDPRVRGVLKSMGLEIVFWSKDTRDAQGVTDVVERFAEWTKQSGGEISLEHDRKLSYVEEAIKAMHVVIDAGYKLKTVAECISGPSAFLPSLIPKPVAMNSGPTIKVNTTVVARPSRTPSGTIDIGSDSEGGLNQFNLTASEMPSASSTTTATASLAPSPTPETSHSAPTNPQISTITMLMLSLFFLG